MLRESAKKLKDSLVSQLSLTRLKTTFEKQRMADNIKHEKQSMQRKHLELEA
jgi:hypothetical protein